MGGNFNNEQIERFVDQMILDRGVELSDDCFGYIRHLVYIGRVNQVDKGGQRSNCFFVFLLSS